MAQQSGWFLIILHTLLVDACTLYKAFYSVIIESEIYFTSQWTIIEHTIEIRSTNIYILWERLFWQLRLLIKNINDW